MGPGDTEMLPQHGWKPNPSPRRGFTIVESSREVTAQPVIVLISESPSAFRLFRSAVDEAIGRSLDLIVLDCGEVSLDERIRGRTDELTEREVAALRTLWSNPHVRVVRQEPIGSDLEKVIAFCEASNAGLLVLGADHVASAVLDLDRIFDCDFDLLVVADHPARSDRP